MKTRRMNKKEAEKRGNQGGWSGGRSEVRARRKTWSMIQWVGDLVHNQEDDLEGWSEMEGWP
jgi:hypothetical protein